MLYKYTFEGSFITSMKPLQVNRSELSRVSLGSGPHDKIFHPNELTLLLLTKIRNLFGEAADNIKASLNVVDCFADLTASDMYKVVLTFNSRQTKQQLSSIPDKIYDVFLSQQGEVFWSCKDGMQKEFKIEVYETPRLSHRPGRNVASPNFRGIGTGYYNP